MKVRFRKPWDKEKFLEGELKWRSLTHDWCAVRVAGYLPLIQLPFSKVRETW